MAEPLNARLGKKWVCRLLHEKETNGGEKKRNCNVNSWLSEIKKVTRPLNISIALDIFHKTPIEVYGKKERKT